MGTSDEPSESQCVKSPSVQTQPVENHLIGIQSTESPSLETQSVERHAVKNQPTKNESTESQPLETQSVRRHTVENQPTENQSIESQPNETHSVESSLVKDQLTKCQSIESQPIETQSVERNTIKKQPTENQSIESHPEENHSVESPPVKSQPFENRSIKSQPVETHSAESPHVKTQSVDQQFVKNQREKYVETQPVGQPVTTSPDISQPTERDQDKTIVSGKSSSRSACAQILATLIQNTLLIDIGIEMAMPTVVLGALHRHPKEKLCMNDDQASWFGSMSPLFHFIGSLVSGLLQEQFGRKGSMILINIPILVAFLTLYFAESIYALYAVSVTLGLCCGLVEAPLHSYIGEIGEPHLRGTLSTLINSAVSVGYALTYFVGYLVDWRTAALVVSAFPVITFMSMTQIPESPTWLIRRNRLDEAQKSLSWLRGWVTAAEVNQEFQDLVEYTKNSSQQSRVQSFTTESLSLQREVSYFKTKFREITDKKVLRPLRLVFITFMISHCVNLFPLGSYMVGILNDFGFPIDSLLILIMSTASFFVGAMANVVFLRHFGKRKMALFTIGLATVSVLLMGFCSYMHVSNSNWSRLPGVVWIPMILFININFCNGLCACILPWQLVSEVFPLLGRGFASGISAAWSYAIVFIMSKAYLYLEAWIKFSGVMYLLGAMSVFGWLYHYFNLPETEGKSLEQIETYFTKDHDRKEKFSVGKSQQ